MKRKFSFLNFSYLDSRYRLQSDLKGYQMSYLSSFFRFCASFGFLDVSYVVVLAAMLEVESRAELKNEEWMGYRSFFVFDWFERDVGRELIML